jgi:D-sedoheptulose 7-phosphate isomerase
MAMLEECIIKEVREAASVIAALEVHRVKLMRLVEMIERSIRRGGKILLCGNGGSAADAQHIATEFVVRQRKNRRAIPAIALTTDASILTAIGNDLRFERIFARQIEALGKRGDVAMFLSTSGRSRNILLAAREAKRRGLTTVGFSGKGGTLARLVDLPIAIASKKAEHIQEAYLVMLHSVALAVEEQFARHP